MLTTRLFPALLLGLLLTGCAGVAPKSEQAGMTGSKGLSERYALPDIPQRNLQQVPFFPQQAYQCGPAALATVLNARGHKVQPQDLLDQVYLPEKQATLPVEMVSAGRRYGLLAYPLQPELAHLLQQVEAGYPVLVFQNLGLERLPQWHFAVLVGYDLAQRQLILRSGTEREYRTDFTTFINTWQRADHWAYLLLKPGEMPASSDRNTYLQSSLDLAEVGLTVSAQKALEAGVRQWPQDEAMRMALSNTYFQSGLFDDAADILMQSPSLGTSGKLWNNVAYIQLARQCYSSAFQAVQCAVTLSPEDRNIQHSLQDILGKSQRADGSQSCPQLNCPKAVNAL